MLIDGKLVEGRGGALANINPATEELLGEVSDASCEDMAAAIDVARDAFDSTDWSTNRVLRQRCLIQLQDALEQEPVLPSGQHCSSIFSGARPSAGAIRRI